jgi:hypothetical protein
MSGYKPRLGRYLITGADGHRIVCGWDDCGRDGLELHKTLEHQHEVTVGCGWADRRALAASGETAHTWQVFCSERHRLYFVNATGRHALRSITSTGRAYGNLPVGSRGTLL